MSVAMWFCNFFSVEVRPSEGYVATPGGPATFNCVPDYSDYNRLIWFVNDTLLEDTNLTNVTTMFSTIGYGIGLLKFTNIPLKYNMTNVRCGAEFNSGENITSNNVAILLLQGESVKYKVERELQITKPIGR